MKPFDVLLALLLVGFANMALADDLKIQFLEAVARDIEGFKGEYPQLEAFSASKQVDQEGLALSYDFRTHPSTHRGGWTAGVPNPDPDGLWFYIDIHSPDSTAQIHTQPVVPMLCLGTDRVMLLILEGAETKTVGGELWKLLEKHGAKPCAQD